MAPTDLEVAAEVAPDPSKGIRKRFPTSEDAGGWVGMTEGTTSL